MGSNSSATMPRKVLRKARLPSAEKLAEMQSEVDAMWASQLPYTTVDGKICADIVLRFGYLSGTLTLSQPADRSGPTVLSGIVKTGLHQGRSHHFSIQWATYGGCPQEEKKPGVHLGTVTPPKTDELCPEGRETPFVFNFPIELRSDKVHMSGPESVLGDGSEAVLFNRTVLRISGYGSDSLEGATCHLIGQKLPPVEVLSTHSPLLDGVPPFEDIPAPESVGREFGFYEGEDKSFLTYGADFTEVNN